MSSRACAALVVLLAVVLPSEASALITNVRQIDGPSSSVLELGGVAMAEDGTGGLVYRKRFNGRAHVFAARFTAGAWSAPQRIDTTNAFDAYWPRIGAGNGGRLVVTWAQEFGAGSDRMFSATLDPGASSFQRPIPFDFNIGEATSTFPSLAMSRAGQAYLTYRVVTDASSGSNPPGYVGADVRVARYNGSLWSVNGTPVDRNPGVPVRTPTAANSPKVGIDQRGTGVVAFQEPGDDFVDRIWARRLFGSSTGFALIASPTSFGGAPLRGPADGFGLDVAQFGQAAVTLRQQPGSGSRLGNTRLFVNTIGDEFTEGANSFGGPRLLDGGARAAPGIPSVGITARDTFLSAFGSGATTLATSGDTGDVGRTERIDDGRSTAAPEPVLDQSEDEAGALAWKSRVGSRGVVTVQERRADGVPETTDASASSGGPVNQLALSGSGQGDAIVGFGQGGSSFAQIAAVVIDAPPRDFLVVAPQDWIRRRRTGISWQAAASAVSPVTYTVSIDDEPVKEGIRGLGTVLGRNELDDGRHTLEMIAVDSFGQETTARAEKLNVDRTRPRARLKRKRGRKLSVRVADATSRLRRSSVSISWGDRKRTKRRPRATHRYRRAGRYRVTIKARDRAGNRATIRKRVRIR